MNAHQRGWLLPPAAISLVAGIFLGRSFTGLLFPILALITAVIAILLLRSWLRFFACVVFCFVLGVTAGCIAFHPSLPPEDDYAVRGVVSDEVTSGSFGQVRVYLSDIQLNGRPFRGGAYWTFYTDDPPAGLLPGQTVSFRASLYEPRGAVNPDGFNFREYLLQRGVVFCLYGCEELQFPDEPDFSFTGWTASLRHRLSEGLINTLGKETGAYASAMLLGMRSMIPSEDRLAFSRLGLAHVLTVSGFHVGILIGALAWLFSLLRLRPGWRFALYAVVLFFYASLCGMSQPVMRASLLLLLNLEGRILNRPRSGLHSLCAALFLMALLSPVQVTSASFQMTFCAMFGLIWVAPLVRRLRGIRLRPLRIVCESFVTTAGVQLGLLLPMLWFFQRLPLLIFLLNLPALAVTGVLISLFWAVLLLLPLPGVAGLLSVPLSAVTGILLSGIRRLSSIPGLTLWLHSPTLLTAAGILLLFTGLCAAFRLRPSRRGILAGTGALLLVLSLLPVNHTATEYIQFSAGNADAAVLWDRNQVYVFDTGENDGTLSGFLRAHRLTPDAVILTHLHADHAGGLRSMMDDEIPIRKIMLPAGAEEQQVHPDFLALLDELEQGGTEIVTLSRGDTLPLPSGSFTVLWPEADKIRPGQDANRYSLVTRLNLKETILLHTGDITGSYESYCAVPADILKAAHHGSRASTSPAFLSAVSPSAVILSCQRPERLEDYRSRLNDLPVFGTPEAGAITVFFEEGRYTVSPFISSF
jgi:ComEC/Rec2-related protein